MYTTRRRIATWLCRVLALVMFVPAVSAQDEPNDNLPPRYGGFLHLNLNLHRAGFARLPGVPNCCREFTGGSGLGFTVGASYLHPLGALFSLDLSAGYSSLGARLVESENTTVIVGTEPVTGEFEHQLEAGLDALLVEPSIRWRPTARLSVRAGPGLSFLLGATYSQQEQLIRPEEVGVFENGRRIRNEFGGDIPDAASLLPYAHVGAGYDLPLNDDGTLIATPELLYMRGFSSVVRDSVWNVDALRVGIAVTWSSRPAALPVVADIPPPSTDTSDRTDPDVTDTAPDPLVPSIRAVGLQEDGSEVPTATLRVEEFISTHMRPLLNYVFFDENSAVVPDRYRELNPDETTAFRVERLHGVGTIPTYHHLLNVVGRRMREHPEAKITIIGCNDGLGEKQGRDRMLSRDRAGSVSRYLHSVWGIDSTRMTVEARGIPAKPSNVEDPDGIEENRRVELYSDTWEILAPVITDDTLRVTNPPVIRFRPDAVSPAPITGWELTAVQGDVPLKRVSEQEELPETIDWNLEREQATIPRADRPLEYVLSVTDSLGRTVQAVGDPLEVEQITVSRKRRERIADKFIDRYSLILFDFDRADFNDANERIGEFIRERIREGATVTITGYTDRIGEEEYNLRLSERRADRTAEELETSAAEVSGLGETVELHDNELPEGRFYSRTVTIVVETPVGE